MYNYSFIIFALISLCINFLITPVLIKTAHRYSWFDKVNQRTIHTGEIPRIGGIGIVFSFIITIVLYFIYNRIYSPISNPFQSLFHYWPLLLGALIINLLGLLDDFTDLKARYKLIIQLIAALLMVASGKYFVNFYIPGFNYSIHLDIIGPVFTVVWIIGITNAVNLIDGMDGLSSGITEIILFFMGMAAVYSGYYSQALLIFILFGSVLSFMFFNFPPAKLFMGDSGSLFLGFFLACMPLYSSYNNAYGLALIISISFLFIPILDTIAAILRRIRKGIPFYSPDKHHLHHRLLKLGLSTRKILLIIYSVTLILSLSAYLFIKTENMAFVYSAFGIWFIMIVLFIILVNKTRDN